MTGRFQDSKQHAKRETKTLEEKKEVFGEKASRSLDFSILVWGISLIILWKPGSEKQRGKASGAEGVRAKILTKDPPREVSQLAVGKGSFVVEVCCPGLSLGGRGVA